MNKKNLTKYFLLCFGIPVCSIAKSIQPGAISTLQIHAEEQAFQIVAHPASKLASVNLGIKNLNTCDINSNLRGLEWFAYGQIANMPNLAIYLTNTMLKRSSNLAGGIGMKFGSQCRTQLSFHSIGLSQERLAKFSIKFGFNPSPLSNLSSPFSTRSLQRFARNVSPTDNTAVTVNGDTIIQSNSRDQMTAFLSSKGIPSLVVPQDRLNSVVHSSSFVVGEQSQSIQLLNRNHQAIKNIKRQQIESWNRSFLYMENVVKNMQLELSNQQSRSDWSNESISITQTQKFNDIVQQFECIRREKNHQIWRISQKVSAFKYPAIFFDLMDESNLKLYRILEEAVGLVQMFEKESKKIKESSEVQEAPQDARRGLEIKLKIEELGERIRDKLIDLESCCEDASNDFDEKLGKKMKNLEMLADHEGRLLPIALTEDQSRLDFLELPSLDNNPANGSIHNEDEFSSAVDSDSGRETNSREFANPIRIQSFVDEVNSDSPDRSQPSCETPDGDNVSGTLEQRRSRRRGVPSELGTEELSTQVSSTNEEERSSYQAGSERKKMDVPRRRFSSETQNHEDSLRETTREL